jgi:hypothetical protein
VRGKADEKVREPDVMIDTVCWTRMAGPGGQFLSLRNSCPKKQASSYNTPLVVSIPKRLGGFSIVPRYSYARRKPTTALGLFD